MIEINDARAHTQLQFQIAIQSERSFLGEKLKEIIENRYLK